MKRLALDVLVRADHAPFHGNARPCFFILARICSAAYLLWWLAHLDIVEQDTFVMSVVPMTYIEAERTLAGMQVRIARDACGLKYRLGYDIGTRKVSSVKVRRS